MNLPLARPAEIGLDPERTRRLLGVLQSEIDRQRVPGAVALIARHGKVGLFESLGVQDPKTGTPMTPDSVFRIHSMTKPIVSAAVMMLLEQGRLLLDDPIAKYLPEFSHMQVAVETKGVLTLEPARRAITIQDLLRHTAGMTYEFSGNAHVHRLYQGLKADVGGGGLDNTSYCRALAALPLMYQPGTVGEYSRSIDVLGRLVEVLSGQTLGRYLREQVFTPLGMADTGFFVPQADHGRVAEPFAHDPDGGVPWPLHDPRLPPTMESGGGGLVSTAMDYARLLQCFLDRGALGGTRLLGPRIVDYMTCDHLGSIPAGESLLDPGEGFGLGFAIRQGRGVTQVAGSPGMYYWSGMGGCSFFVDPSLKLFAILMVQAPNQRAWYRQLFRNLVYAALAD